MEVTVIWTGFANLRLGPEYGIVQILDANTATANLRCGGTCKAGRYFSWRYTLCMTSCRTISSPTSSEVR